MVTRWLFAGMLGVGMTLGLGMAQVAGPTRLKEGDGLPPVKLQDQNGKKFHFDSLKGNAVVVTFIFSRCSVPTFCPTMTANFRALQEAIRKDDALAGRVHLVSVSIDPAYDSPAVLKRYAEHFAIDTSDWSFVTGDKQSIADLAAAFSVYMERVADGSIDHTLATAVVGPDGKIRKLWRDNRWTPEAAVKELHTALGAASS